jgi:hypothetical protein
MTASMKVIRAVAPSGGPGGVTQDKEESGKHQLIMTASMKVIRVMAKSFGLTTAWAAAGLED